MQAGFEKDVMGEWVSSALGCFKTGMQGQRLPIGTGNPDMPPWREARLAERLILLAAANLCIHSPFRVTQNTA